uniref:Uncharacterized protein n=1 Tax=Trypanosoma congolense (strain IL3000) TaxID=1068625 RepID=G0V076_TRYCI|nr:hypothetical protein, unlikely [Trypanosoma congolense IL3000]
MGPLPSPSASNPNTFASYIGDIESSALESLLAPTIVNTLPHMAPFYISSPLPFTFPHYTSGAATVPRPLVVLLPGWLPLPQRYQHVPNVRLAYDCGDIL